MSSIQQKRRPPSLPLPLEQPAFGQVRDSNELRRCGGTIK